MGLKWFVNAYYSHSIHNAKGVGPQSTKRSFLGMQGDDFTSEPDGIVEVAVWLCVPLLLGLWCSLDLVPNYVMLVPGNEGGGPHHMQGCHTQDLWIGFKKLVVLTSNINSSNIQLRLKINVSSWDLCLTQKLIRIYVFYINHIALGMCNSLKCWFN